MNLTIVELKCHRTVGISQGCLLWKSQKHQSFGSELFISVPVKHPLISCFPYWKKEVAPSYCECPDRKICSAIGTGILLLLCWYSDSIKYTESISRLSSCNYTNVLTKWLRYFSLERRKSEQEWINACIQIHDGTKASKFFPTARLVDGGLM